MFNRKHNLVTAASKQFGRLLPAQTSRWDVVNFENRVSNVQFNRRRVLAEDLRDDYGQVVLSAALDGDPEAALSFSGQRDNSFL